MNFFLKIFSKNIEQLLSSIIILPFSKLLINKRIFFGSITLFFLIFFCLIKFFAFFFSEIKKISILSLINKRQFGIGLLGLSYPLIFNNQATFSGALINKYLDFFSFIMLTTFLILLRWLSPTTLLSKEKKGL